MEADLSGLRDIHLPIEPSWWPPAPGWWFVLGGLFLFVLSAGAGYLYWSTRPRQYALRELKSVYQATPNSVILARQISALLKRIALLNYPRNRVAALTEKKWINFLTKKTGAAFTEAQLNLLAASTYMPDKALTPEDPQDLYQAAIRAVNLLFERKHHGYKSRKSS